MGTDIHPKLWVKREYWSPVEPVFRYHWNTEHLFRMEKCFGLDFGKPNFPELKDWSGDYYSWSMQREAAEIKHLSDHPGFIEANNMLLTLSDRNYNFFAILADVRNGHGFAGVPTGSKFTPISEPRGFDDLPFDLEEEEYEYGDHSYSWVTVRELLDYPWDQQHTGMGVVPLQEYKRLRENRPMPNEWSGGIWGNDIVTVNEEEADALLDGKQTPVDGIAYYVNYSWQETCREAVGERIYNAIHWIGRRIDPDTTYLVFGFDS